VCSGALLSLIISAAPGQVNAVGWQFTSRFPKLHGPLAAAFTTGLHAAFYTMMVFMAVAAVLSAVRLRGTAPAEPAAQDQQAETAAA
jgi:hypothetical protein